MYFWRQNCYRIIQKDTCPTEDNTHTFLFKSFFYKSPLWQKLAKSPDYKAIVQLSKKHAHVSLSTHSKNVQKIYESTCSRFL